MGSHVHAVDLSHEASTASLKVLALTRYLRQGASSRLRTYQYLPALKAHGIDVDVQPLLGAGYLRDLYAGRRPSRIDVARDYLRRLRVLLTSRRYDLLWIEYELFPRLPALAERLLSAAGVRYAVDYDDAIFHRYDLKRGPVHALMKSKIDVVMRLSSLVVCGNDYLAERARRAGAPNVQILPTVVDVDRYAMRPTRPTDRPVIGWIGSPSSIKYLEIVAPELQALAAERPIQLRVVGGQFALDGVDVECRPWSENSEVREVQGFDIGIMPLADSPWERGKCGYKLIQYMACGLAVVASPVGVNGQIVSHGVSGYLPTSPQEWLDALRTLCHDPMLRERMGAAGRRVVEARYSLSVTGPRLARMLTDAAGGRNGDRT